MTKTFSVLLLTLDTTPAGHFFSQTQSPCHVHGITSWNSAQGSSCGELAAVGGSPQTQPRWSCQGRRPSSCGPTLSGEASSCPAGFSRCFRHLASAHTETRDTRTQSAFRHQQKQQKTRGKKVGFCTDPSADLSVDEDQVIQSQNYFCCSASPASEAEAYSSISPGQRTEGSKWAGCPVSLSHTGVLLWWTYLKAKKKLAPTPASAIRRSKRNSSVTESMPLGREATNC